MPAEPASARAQYFESMVLTDAAPAAAGTRKRHDWARVEPPRQGVAQALTSLDWTSDIQDYPHRRLP